MRRSRNGACTVPHSGSATLAQLARDLAEAPVGDRRAQARHQRGDEGQVVRASAGARRSARRRARGSAGRRARARRRRPGRGSPRRAAPRRRGTPGGRPARRQRFAGSATSATPWRARRVGIAQSKVSIPSSTPRIRSSTSPIPSRWRGRSGARRSSSRVVQSTTSYICALSWPSEPPIATPSAPLAATASADCDPQVLVDAALDDRRRRAIAARWPGAPWSARQRRQRSSQRCVRSVERGGVVAVDVKRRALVEREHDVGVQLGLHRHRDLRADEPLGAVDVGAEAHALLLDREDRAAAAPPPLPGAARRP